MRSLVATAAGAAALSLASVPPAIGVINHAHDVHLKAVAAKACRQFVQARAINASYGIANIGKGDVVQEVGEIQATLPKRITSTDIDATDRYAEAHLAYDLLHHRWWKIAADCKVYGVNVPPAPLPGTPTTTTTIPPATITLSSSGPVATTDYGQLGEEQMVAGPVTKSYSASTATYLGISYMNDVTSNGSGPVTCTITANGTVADTFTSATEADCSVHQDPTTNQWVGPGS